jgi:hypothetical protein
MKIQIISHLGRQPSYDKVQNLKEHPKYLLNRESAGTTRLSFNEYYPEQIEIQAGSRKNQAETRNFFNNFDKLCSIIHERVVFER